MSHFFRICRIMSYITNIIKHMITQYFKDILLKKKIKDISQGGMCNLLCY